MSAPLGTKQGILPNLFPGQMGKLRSRKRKYFAQWPLEESGIHFSWVNKGCTQEHIVGLYLSCVLQSPSCLTATSASPPHSFCSLFQSFGAKLKSVVLMIVKVPLVLSIKEHWCLSWPSYEHFCLHINSEMSISVFLQGHSCGLFFSTENWTSFFLHFNTVDFRR